MPQQLTIGKYLISDQAPCFLIAEAGVNHNGRLDLAQQLIDAAVAARADAVKFQTFKTEDLILSDIEKASYQKVTTSAGESQTQMLKKLEIDRDFHLKLLNYCAQKKIIFLSTCYEEASLNLLMELGVCAVKVASTDTTNLLFLEKVARTGKPIILSTGMCSLSEIKQAFQCLKENGAQEIALLKCTSNYPTAINEVNLKAMATLKENFDCPVGFSDHTPGVGASPYAVALGAKIIEKHFTLDKNLDGPDHRASLSPDELISWVQEIRRVEQMLGTSEVSPTPSEHETKRALQKHLVSKGMIRKGEKITRENIVAKRTGGVGIVASESFKVLGKTLASDMSSDQPLSWAHLEK